MAEREKLASELRRERETHLLKALACLAQTPEGELLIGHLRDDATSVALALMERPDDDPHARGQAAAFIKLARQIAGARERLAELADE
jgi:uncharacterized membrane protein YccC